MEQHGIFKKISKRTPFLSYPLLLYKSTAEPRFIVDYSNLTPHLKVTPMHLPAFANVLRAATLPCGLRAIRLDLRHAFYSLLLHPKARHLTAFAVGQRRFRFTRLPMGLSPSPGFLQRVLLEIIQLLKEGADLVWAHVDDIITIAKPHSNHSLREKLIERIVPQTSLSIKRKVFSLSSGSH